MEIEKILTNTRFGCRVVVSEVTKDASGLRRVHCRCDCGRESIVRLLALTTGKANSCGCQQGNKTHGLSGTPAHRSWECMKQRCFNPKRERYSRYGARGITVCERWLTFENFLADMGERPENTTLDRINPDGNYEPGNCRWATQHTQDRNRSGVTLLTHDDKTQCLSDWSKDLGLNRKTLREKLKRGQSIAEISAQTAQTNANRQVEK